MHLFPALPLGHKHLKSYGDVSMHVPPKRQVVNVHGLKILSEEIDILNYVKPTNLRGKVVH